MPVIGVTGPEGAGKTTLAINIGGYLAVNGARTLLIDANLYFPDMSFYLDMRPNYPLHLYLEDHEMDIEWLVTPHEGLKNLYLILGEPMKPIQRRYSFKLMTFLIAYLREHYGVIIVDFPPGLPVEPLPIIPEIDHQILVIDPTIVPLRNLKMWVESLIIKFSHMGAEKLWVLINKPLIPEKNLIELEDFIVDELGIPVIGTIPYDVEIHESTRTGTLLCEMWEMENPVSELAYSIEELFL
ncbi:AAA family ATPase [Thermococcus pacificus]|uniref:ATPase n=1 Tax=Thermococcus pacificus TaxID=71998 RepID=A0A218P8W9_9EURY|nr:MinD/ParA family protein [Thermococcus pacificus]ASJ07237.1 ATPase [Thermococcus pacificus]